MRRIDRVKGLQCIAVNKFYIPIFDLFGEREHALLVFRSTTHTCQRMLEGSDLDSLPLVLFAQRTISGAVNNWVNYPGISKAKRQLELTARSAFPIEIERAHQGANRFGCLSGRFFAKCLLASRVRLIHFEP